VYSRFKKDMRLSVLFDGCWGPESGLRIKSGWMRVRWFFSKGVEMLNRGSA